MRGVLLDRRSKLAKNAFSPLSVANVMQWGYEFFNEPVGALGSVTDISGKARTLTAAGAVQPVNTAAVIDGRSAALFDGVDDRLTATGFTLTQPTTIVYVASFVTASGSRYLYDGSGDGSRRNILITNGTTSFQMFAGTLLSAGAGGTGWHIFVASYNGASSVLRVDGGAGTAGNAGTQQMANLSIGAAYNATTPGNAYHLAGYCYSGAVSVADLNALAAYLQGIAPSLPWTAAT